MHGATALVRHAVSLGAAKSVSVKKIGVRFENSYKKVLEIKKIRWGEYEYTRLYPHPNPFLRYPFFTLPIIPHTQRVY
jgi:hypothetical protein